MDKKKLIGIFAVDISSRVQGNLYIELHKKAIECGYNLVLFSGTYDKISFRNITEASFDLFEQAQYMDFEAFFIHAQSIGNVDIINKIITIGKEKNIPVFVYDGETVGITKMEGIIAIEPNYKQGFAEGVKHLIEHHKCKDIFMMAGMKDNKYSDDRIEMYKKELEAHGLEYSEDKVVYGDFWEDPAIVATNKILEICKGVPEAICCANDAMAIAAVKTLKKHGIRVPEDVLVTGFDGIEDGKYTSPRISSCEPVLEGVAELVFKVLLEKYEVDEFLIPLKFYPKESCGCNMDYVRADDKIELARLIDNTRTSVWQHSMLSTMQFELLERDNVEAVFDFMQGILGLFDTYSHLFFLRDNIESLSDYTVKQRKMNMYLNKGFQIEEHDNEGILFDKIAYLFDKAEPEDIFMLRLIHHADNRYGCHIMRNNYYSSNELNLLAQFTETVTIVLEGILRNIRLELANQKLSEMYEKMSEIYIRDTMTGLYNRHGYYQSFDEYIKRDDISQGYVQIISIDMDGMKQINDNFGHQEGDNAIKAVANAIKECFAQPCVCARFGGDEFGVALFTDSEEGPSAEKITAKLNNYLSNLPMLENKGYKVVVSVGQATARLSDVDDFKAIEKLADDYMYIEKRRHKAKVK